jgi:hypothetical protein
MSDMEKVIEKALQYVPMVDASQTRIREIQAQKIAQALTAAGYGGFEMVPLVWRNIAKDEWLSINGAAVYRVIIASDGMYMAEAESPVEAAETRRTFKVLARGVPTLEAAFAACEADHRERVSKMVRGVDVSELVEAVRGAVQQLDGGFFRCEICGHQHDNIGKALDPVDDLRAALPPAPEVN